MLTSPANKLSFGVFKLDARVDEFRKSGARVKV